ncbi:MAG TPA: shikimate dehydrogenase [Solirubrobacteraceae bacterium]|nr:shikimate dehydrogenase [Solirubrobacteraceae bacterium]
MSAGVGGAQGGTGPFEVEVEDLPARRLGVLGWPVAHSRSPQMHKAALRALGLHDWRYQRLPVVPELFAETVRALPGAGFVGANVTVPHKRAALELATDATERARAIGAANTLTFGPGGGIEADNTDAPGFLAALPASPAGATALVLGAGGSARAVVWALGQAGASEIAVWNRTPERAEALVAELGGRAVTRAIPAELLVNCTSVGLGPKGANPAETFKSLPVTADGLDEYQCIIDLVYQRQDTALLASGRARGIPVIDGLEVLVWQGALSLERWTGREAPIEAMRAGARQP